VKFKTSVNISLKENKIFFLFSQIENQRFSTSLNNNIMFADCIQMEISQEVFHKMKNSRSECNLFGLTSQKGELTK